MSLKEITRKRSKWLIIISLVLLVKLFSLNRSWVENLYSTGIYPHIARFFRIIFGWIPVSIGDICYLLAAIWLIWKMIKLIKLVVKKQLKKRALKSASIKGLYFLLVLYLVFNLAWGLNYNRSGPAKQLALTFENYDSSQLLRITSLLADKVNDSKQLWMQQDRPYPNNEEMFRMSKAIYDDAKSTYPFLQFETPSIKPSMFSLVGNYFGFTGYYNPFSGEAQLNTSVPAFIQPFTTAHEMAHQVGYAKENEASFVAFLAISATDDQLFKYSCYLDMFVFARRELYYFDSTASKALTKKLIPEVRADLEEWKRFTKKFSNPVEPIIRWGYGFFLKLNDQPQGILTYDEVIGNLIAFEKKFGRI